MHSYCKMKRQNKREKINRNANYASESEFQVDQLSSLIVKFHSFTALLFITFTITYACNYND